jgi:hypothetical protein
VAKPMANSRALVMFSSQKRDKVDACLASSRLAA